jgi:hypothetical protein
VIFTFAIPPRSSCSSRSQVSKIGHDEGQIKTLRFELQNFVCDGEYARGMGGFSRLILVVWEAWAERRLVNGFGGGGSHLVKVLRYLWEDYPLPMVLPRSL